MAEHAAELPERIGDQQRNGSIAAIALVLGFSLSFTATWSQNDEPWTLRALAVVAVAGAGILCQLSAFMRLLALPNLSVAAHAGVTTLFRSGLIAVLAAYALNIAFDAACDLTGGMRAIPGLICG
jgi:hypothetical protein